MDILYFNTRTAKEAEDNIRRAIQKGEQLPDDDRFDSNCITPGILRNFPTSALFERICINIYAVL